MSTENKTRARVAFVVAVMIAMVIAGGGFGLFNGCEDDSRRYSNADIQQVHDSLYAEWQEASHDWDILARWLYHVQRANTRPLDSTADDSARLLDKQMRQAGNDSAIAHRDGLRLRAENTKASYNAFRISMGLITGEPPAEEQIDSPGLGED